MGRDHSPLPSPNNDRPDWFCWSNEPVLKSGSYYNICYFFFTFLIPRVIRDLLNSVPPPSLHYSSSPWAKQIPCRCHRRRLPPASWQGHLKTYKRPDTNKRKMARHRSISKGHIAFLVPYTSWNKTHPKYILFLFFFTPRESIVNQSFPFETPLSTPFFFFRGGDKLFDRKGMVNVLDRILAF
jgi:hypothetical protein